MSSDDQTSRILSDLELSEYEIRAYLSVLEGGILVARDISDRASIPYAKVYQTLNDLIEKQLIIGDEGRPKKFRARPPEDAIQDRLDHLQKQWMNKHQKRTNQIAKILPELNEIFQDSEVQTEDEQGVWNILGKTNIQSRMEKLAKRAENSILVVTGNFQEFVDNFLNAITTDNKTKLQLLTSTIVEDSVFDKVFANNSVGNAITIFFDSFAMISIAEIQKGRYSSGEFTAVLTQIRELVESTKQTYEGLTQ